MTTMPVRAATLVVATAWANVPRVVTVGATVGVPPMTIDGSPAATEVTVPDPPPPLLGAPRTGPNPAPPPVATYCLPLSTAAFGVPEAAMAYMLSEPTTLEGRDAPAASGNPTVVSVIEDGPR